MLVLKIETFADFIQFWDFLSTALSFNDISKFFFFPVSLLSEGLRNLMQNFCYLNTVVKTQ